MLKLAAGLAGGVLCLPLMVAEPSFSQRAQPAPLTPPLRQSPSLDQPSPLPSSAPVPSPRQVPSAQPEPEPSGQPGAAAQQNTPSPRRTAASHRRHASRRHHRDGRHLEESYVTPWSGPYVIERAHRDSVFLVQGRWFRARWACPGWEASDRVSLRVDASDGCALFNRTRHRACAVSCAGAEWGP